MNEAKRVRFFGKVVKTWNQTTVKTWNGREVEVEQPSQYEIAYREYGADGQLIARGSEDFTPERRDSALKSYTVYTWDGEKRQSGGNRWFEAAMRITINRADRKAALEIARTWYPDATVVELRLSRNALRGVRRR